MLHILSGLDDYSIAQALEKIKSEIGDQATLAVSSSTLDGQQLTLEELRKVCETAPFLGGRRLVIINGLLERFEPKRRPRRQSKTATKARQQNGYKVFSDYFPKIPESTDLVLVDGRINDRNPLFKAIARSGNVRLFPLFGGAKLREWLNRRVHEKGGEIAPDAIDLMIRLIGNNLWIMSTETDKLLLYASSRRIEVDDVNKVVSYARQEDVFAMVDAIMGSKAALAERLVEELLKRGNAPAYLLFMLARQVGLIVRTKELKEQKKSQGEIQGKLGLTDYALRKTQEQAGKYPLPRLKEVYQYLLEADLAIKTGKYDGELALNILVAELCK